jgi:hypothetical protein
MRTKSKTIFSSSSVKDAEEVETKKSSYWHEKIFAQVKGRVKIQNNSIFQGMSQAAIDKGPTEVAKSKAVKTEKNRQAVEDVINNSNRVLLKVSSVFPWDLFPSKIAVEDTRLIIVHRQFLTSQVHSVDIKNVSNIFINTGIIFAELAIISDTFAQNQIIINRLWKKDAILVRSVIEGLRTFIAHNIDTTSLQTKELVEKLKELNETQNATGIIQ